MVSHRPFPGPSDEARWDREDSIPIGGWRPGWAAVVQSLATIGRDGVSPSFPGLHLVGTVSHRPFPRLSDEAHRDREDSIPTGGWRPGGAAVVQSLATIGRGGVSPSFPGLHLVGTVSHRPFPRLSDEAHRDREDSIPTGDGGPAGHPCRGVSVPAAIGSWSPSCTGRCTTDD